MKVKDFKIAIESIQKGSFNKFAKNMKILRSEYTLSSYLNAGQREIHEIIECAFLWHKTKQGNDYWRNIHKVWRERYGF